MSHNFQAIDEKLFRLYNTIIEMLDVLATKVKNDIIEPLSRKDEATAYANLTKINPKITIDRLVKGIMQSFKAIASIKNKLDKNPEVRKATMQNVYNKVASYSSGTQIPRVS